jgi:hypothetical protein
MIVTTKRSSIKQSEKGPFNIYLKVRRPDTPLVEGKKGKELGPI